MNIRCFQLNNEWNIIHYPERPNGFAVMVLGNESHFVDGKNSFWMQHPGRQKLIEEMLSEGYMVFYSNLFGKHWGSAKAIDHVKQLYHFIMRSEILNKKIHLFAEGMGALVAVQLMNEWRDKIRSVIMVNPILSILEHLKEEKENKFFFKKLNKELATAYQCDRSEVEAYIKKADSKLEEFKQPTKFFYIVSGTINKSRKPYVKAFKNADIRYILPEKRYDVGKQITTFFMQHEKEL